MNPVSVNGKGLHILKQRNSNIEQTCSEIEKLLGISTDSNGDEVAQYEVDQFIADRFYMMWPKAKVRKQTIKRPSVVATLQQNTGLFSPDKTVNVHNESVSTENATNRPVLDIAQNCSYHETKIQRVDAMEVKVKELDFLLKESFEAYCLEQYSLAVAKYKITWEMIADVNLKSHIKHINEDVVCYMLCLSMLETSQLNNLSEAVELLLALEKRSAHVLPAVFYALSKAHHKHYRFAVAMKEIEKGFSFLEGDAELTEYKIPGSDVILKESTRDGLSACLSAMKDECSKWHPPDAVCCLSECLPNSRWYGLHRNIFFSDPAFNGMVVLTCSNTKNPCNMKYHLVCWKTKKDQLSALKKLSDKEILGYECFTPNCKSSQDTHSLIIKIEVYGDDGRLKTQIEVPANPVVWMQRRTISKGAIPKQPVKQKTLSKKIRQPIGGAVPRSNTKDTMSVNRTAKLSRLLKLDKLRKNNFGIKPAYEWRPDMAMYGNPQMMEVGNFLGSPIFENDGPELMTIKTFIFTYFYKFIKENGCIKRKEILQKWEEDKFIFDNHSKVLTSETDICDFLLQSYKLVSVGDYIGIAENLPELYRIVQSEIRSYLRFLLADLQKGVVQGIGSADSSQPNMDVKSCQQSETDEHPYNSMTQDMLPFAKSKSSKDPIILEEQGTLLKDTLDPNSSQMLEKSHNLNHSLQYAEIRSLNGSNRCQPGSQTIFGAREEKNMMKPEIYSKEGVSNGVHSQPQGLTLTDSMEQVSLNKEFHEYKLDAGNFKLDGTNQNMQDIESRLVDPAVGCEFLTTDNYRSSATNPSCEETLTTNTHIAGTKSSERSVTERQNCFTLMGTELMETAIETENLSAFQCPDTLAGSNVEKLQNDLAATSQIVTQLKSVLQQNQQKSENDIQMLQLKLKNYKAVSEESMAELVKDLSRLEARCTKLELEKSEISLKFLQCEIDLHQCNDKNVLLTLKNTELTQKYDKLSKEQKEVEHNFDLLIKEKCEITNRCEMLQKERDKLDKKLQKCHARLKDKHLKDTKSISSLQEEQDHSEQRRLDETRFSERQLKLQSLNHEFNINMFALERALEKCYDHVSMLNEVSKLMEIATGQQFVLTEAQAAWRNADYCLRCTFKQYKEDYMRIKAMLEFNKDIEPLSDINLPAVNIVFPLPPNLVEFYYNHIHRRMSEPPIQFVAPGVAPQDPRYFARATSAPYLGENSEPRSNYADDRLTGHGVFNSNPPQEAYTNNGINRLALRGPNNNMIGAELHREEHTVPLQELTKIADTIPSTEIQDSDNVVSHGSSLYDGENEEERLLQSDFCTGAVGGSALKGSSPTSVNRQSAPGQKIGRDLLIQELKKKFVGVSEFDLHEAVQVVRRLHNNTLSGMRVQDIIQESAAHIKQRQAKHIAHYSESKQMLPRERSIPKPKPSHRKLSSSTSLDYQFSRIPATIPPLMKKPAWEPLTSGLIEWKKNEEDTECTICFEHMNMFDKRAPIYILPCQHSFHTMCIKKWLGETSVCPICRIHCTMDDEFPPLPS